MDSAYRIPFVVSNSESIQLNIDPNTTVATHSWIVNTLTTAYFLPGGTTGQVLKKNSNIEGDVGWGDASTAEVFVTTIEEEQALVADQTVVDLTKVTTHGAAVYINGDRITNKAGADGWIATSAKKITLGKAYPDSKILIVQNTPLGAAPYPLAQQNNLADILNKSLARQNLGVMSSDEAKYNDCPPGTVITLASPNIPTAYRLLKCNGAAVSRTAYAELFAAVGTYFGAGDGVNTFNVPDARGEFPRYADDGRGIDAGRVVGSKQNHAMQDHYHGTGDFLSDTNDDWYAIIRDGWDGSFTGRWVAGESQYYYGLPVNGGSGGRRYTGTSNQKGVLGTETRPRNIAWLACIRY